MAIRSFLILLSGLVMWTGHCSANSFGKTFVTAFLYNLNEDQSRAKLEVVLTAHHASTTATVTTKGIMFQQNIFLDQGQTLAVELPNSLQLSETDSFDKTVLIQADKEISVYSRNHKETTTGATVVYPVQQLGTVYYVVTPEGKIADTFKEFAVVAYQTPTRVNIHLKGTVQFNGKFYPSGNIIVINLRAFQAIQLQSDDNLSGTKVESDEPVAVLSGHSCVKVNTHCDHVVEQLLPVPSWGTTFIVPSLTIQRQYDTAYVTTSQDTVVTYKSEAIQGNHLMEAGEVFKLNIQPSDPLYISANRGIQVLFFFTGVTRGSKVYDPFLINIPAVESYCRLYHFSGISQFNNYAFIMAKTSKSGGIMLGEKAIRNIKWRPILDTEYSWAQHSLGMGNIANILEHPDTPFGLLIFGLSYHNGYGFVGLCSPPPLSCPENSHFEACGSACRATCSNRTAPSTCDDTCANICQCNEGYIWNGDTCLPMESCNCQYNGMEYKAGEEFWADEGCHKHCMCDPQQGAVVCREDACKGNKICTVVNGVRGCHPPKYFTCIGSGDPHYITFDNRKYDFMGSCIYQMAGLCLQDPTLTPFLVSVENNHRGNKAVSFTKVVTLEIYNMTISLSQQYPQKIQVNKVFVDLPFSYENKVKVFLRGVHGFIQTNFDLRVTFDWYSYARVIIPIKYANAICGLCGNANQDPGDDFTMKDGTQASDEVQFANSWKLKEVPGCSDGCSTNCPVCKEEDKKKYEGDQFCGILIKSDGPLRQCHRIIEPTPYFENCVFDTCAYKGHHDTLCNAISAYVTACQAQGIQTEQWRSDSFCGIHCPQNSHYEFCGSACPATCLNLTALETCEVHCVEGCFCDSGFVLSGGKCVPSSDCGCVYQGRYYKKREEFYTTNSCEEICQCKDNGTLHCHHLSCGPHEVCTVQDGVQGCHSVAYGTAIALGGLYYISFDGRYFRFPGSCTYILAKVCILHPVITDFSVSVKNEKHDNGALVLIKAVVVSIHGYTIILERGTKGKAMVDGKSYTLPMSRDDGKLWITQQGNNIIVRSSFDIKVLYDTSSLVHVSVPSKYQEVMCGLGGNFNGEKRDDFRLPNGELAQNAKTFGAFWKVHVAGVNCSDGCSEGCPTCTTAQTEPYKNKKSCGMITDKYGPFRNCLLMVPSFRDYYEHCLYTMCVTNGKPESLCESLQAYVAACQIAGANLKSWRTTTFCPLTCPDNSYYELCSTPSDISCASLSTSVQWQSNCYEGCQCNEGYFLDGDSCVPIDQCGCVDDGIYLKAGETIFSNNCTRKCTCSRGSSHLTCEEAIRASGESCTQEYEPRGVECKVSQEGQLMSFDGASANFLCCGVYDLAMSCDESAAFWFRVLVNIGTDSDNSLVVGKAIHIFFQDTFITVKKDNKTWVNGRLVKVPYRKDAMTVATVQDGIVVDLASQLHVQLHSTGEITVKVNKTLEEKLCAPCGNFNGDSSDDLKPPNGKTEENISEILHAWKAKDF